MTVLTVEERHHVADTMLYWVLLVFRSGVSTEDLTMFLSILSKNLDAQFEETTRMIAEGQEDSMKVSFTSEQVRRSSHVLMSLIQLDHVATQRDFVFLSAQLADNQAVPGSVFCFPDKADPAKPF